MKELTVSAKESLNAYLQKVRVRLSGAKSLDAIEIERDIREHIERELDQAPEPVECGQVAQVLERLGAPEQWVPDEELSWWWKIIVRMQTEPNDWRLAYICFGLFVLGLIILPLGIIFLIPLSFYIARSAISLAGGLENLQDQKVLLYPSLIFFYVTAAIAVSFWPLVICGVLIDDYWWFVVAALAIWWILLARFLVTRRTLTDKLIYPFGPLLTDKKLRRVIRWSIGLLLASIVMGILCSEISF